MPPEVLSLVAEANRLKNKNDEHVQQAIGEIQKKVQANEPVNAVNATLQLFSYKNTATGSKIKTDETNAGIMLQYDPRWKEVIRYDLFQNRMVFTRTPPWHPDDRPTIQKTAVEDKDITRIVKYAQRNYDAEFSDKTIRAAVEVAAENQAFHPVRDWLRALDWDGVKRVDTWLTKYLGADDTDYHRMVGRWWLISAVARVMKPGCQVDYCIVLEGPQGLQKSTALRTLAMRDEWFLDTMSPIGTKDARQELWGKWIVEIPEFETFDKATTGACKAFITTRIDNFRKSYGYYSAAYERQCVFSATVNLGKYLKDETGNRRYWGVQVGTIDIEKLRDEVEQLWAEVYEMYLRGDRWWPATEDERELMATEAEDRYIKDEMEERVQTWIQEGYADGLLGNQGYLRTADVLEHMLGMPEFDRNNEKVAYREQPGRRGNEQAVGKALRRLGWTSRKIDPPRDNRNAYFPPAPKTSANQT